MGSPTQSVRPKVEISIAGGDDIGADFTKLEWVSFVNGGYMIRAKVSDPWFNKLRKLATEGYLKDGRSKAAPVTIRIKWVNGGQTEQRKAIMTDLEAHGVNEGGQIEFIAIDPPSFYLNAGTADGRVYKGKTSQVIKNVISDFAPQVEADVTETTDNESNMWWMMRQDPHTFIRSMLDWSSSVTPKKTNWVVSSTDNKLSIKEEAQLPPKDYGIYYVNRNDQHHDTVDFEVLFNNLISPFQTKLITSGISAISGQFLDKITDSKQQQVFVTDKNTSNKVNTKTNVGTQTFAKPNKEWATSIKAIPEHSAGDVGLAYEKYIDGRARNMYINMLSLVMRIRMRVTGDPEISDSSTLGTATATLSWHDIDGNPYFLSGRWLLYGFHHIVTQSKWHTDLYLARLDGDADAKIV